MVHEVNRRRYRKRRGLLRDVKGRHRDMMMTQRESSCDMAYLNPSIFVLITRVVSGFTGAIKVDSLARWSEVIDSARSWSLPVVHLDEGGRTRHGEGRGGNRHEKHAVDGRAESLKRRRIGAGSNKSKELNRTTRSQPGVAVEKDVKKSIEKERKMGHGLQIGGCGTW